MLLLIEKRKGRKLSISIKSWLGRRETRGISNNLLRQLRFEDEEECKRFLRMDAETFDEVSLRLCFFKSSIIVRFQNKRNI